MLTIHIYFNCESLTRETRSEPISSTVFSGKHVALVK